MILLHGPLLPLLFLRRTAHVSPAQGHGSFCRAALLSRGGIFNDIDSLVRGRRMGKEQPFCALRCCHSLADRIALVFFYRSWK